jgi:hypothetical protein
MSISWRLENILHRARLCSAIVPFEMVDYGGHKRVVFRVRMLSVRVLAVDVENGGCCLMLDLQDIGSLSA